MADDSITISPGPQFKLAMLVAIAADALQLFLMPLFVEGALSPADDLLDFGVAALMVNLLGWHWEFLPSLFAKLIPGVDLVPFWTIAVANVWRKTKAAVPVEAHENGSKFLPNTRGWGLGASGLGFRHGAQSTTAEISVKCRLPGEETAQRPRLF